MTGIGFALQLHPRHWKLGLREYQGEDWYHLGPIALVVEVQR